MSKTAREVIAEALEAGFDANDERIAIDAPWSTGFSDAILFALEAAGWVLTRKDVNGALDDAAREFILDAYRKAGGPTDKLREAFALYMENASPGYTERRNALKKENRE